MTFADFLFQASFCQWVGLLLLAGALSAARLIAVKYVKRAKPDKEKNHTP